MRKFLALGVVVAAMLSAPAVAQAHHLDQDSSSVVCVLNGSNAPTIQVVANYKGFGAWDLPVYWSASIDKQTVGGGTLSWVGADYSHRVSFQTTPGNHDFVYQASWNDGDNGGYLSRRGLYCPAPPPPQPTPTPPPAPTPTPTPPPPPPTTTTVVIVYCNGVQMPAGTTTCPPPTPPQCKRTCKPAKPRAACPTHLYERRDYRISWVPRHARTGYVTFRLHGPKATKIRWYIAGHRHGMHRYEHVWSHGRRFTLPVWSRDAWSRLPGTHRVSAHFRTPCGKQHVSVLYANIDPPGPARTSRRSSWG